MIPVEKLYIATIADDTEALARSHGVGLELDQFCTAANMDGEAFAEWDTAARTMLAATARAVIHAPFAELCPAAIDPLVREVATRRYAQAYALAEGYGIKRMVVHAGYIPNVYMPEWFVEQSVAFWEAFMSNKPEDFTLLLENVLESDPAMLAEIVERIGDPRVRLCFDIGHAFLQSAHPLAEWVEVLGQYITHVHIHNNNGDWDSHSPVREGKIPIRDIVGRLLKAAPQATFTLEMAHAGPSLEALLPPAPGVAGDATEEMLKRVFGYDDFREGQREVVEAQVAGRDALGIMPTGSGKSICFQLPALLREGVAIVISPLISLMKDQVAALNQSGVRAAYLNSSLTERQLEAAMRNAEAGAYKIIYVAPERLLTSRFMAFAAEAKISLVAVDEAHCISQWGQDFRPSYLDIPHFIARLRTRPPVSAFTATATPQVRQDILALLALESPVQVQTGFDRPNLYYEVQRPKGKKDALLKLMERYGNQSGIIYCATRKAVEEVRELLASHGYAATRYHAGLGDEERRRNQEDFTYDRCPVIVATNAFGMGIDKSNVRFIIHYNMPKDIESYYQEAGRAGRDGERAECVLLYSGQDVNTQRYMIDQEDESDAMPPEQREALRQNALNRLQEMVSYSRTQKCLRAHILRYFGEGETAPCGNCGSCDSKEAAQDVSGMACSILRCVRDSGERYGLGTVLEVLRGARSQRILQFRLDGNSQYGTQAAVRTEKLRAVAEQLVEEGYLTIKQGKLPIAMLGPRAADALAGEPVMLQLPPDMRVRPRRAAGTAAAGPDMGPGDEDLFAQLRALRMRLATQHGVPAFVIFSDATLKDMAAKRPRDRDAMMDVKGVGEAKVRLYGAEFLRQVELFCENDE